jgi:hypothetical protein
VGAGKEEQVDRNDWKLGDTAAIFESQGNADTVGARSR